MRKTLFIIALLLACIGLSAQNYHMQVFNNAFTLYNKDVNTVEDFRFNGEHMFINDEDGGRTLNVRDIDSIIFRLETPHTGDTVYITYNGNSVSAQVILRMSAKLNLSDLVGASSTTRVSLSSK